MAKNMGFEKQGFRRKYGNVSVQAEIGSRQFQFKSKLEYRWAQHLELLKMGGLIKDWFYEFHTFYFNNAATPKYTPDFLIRNNDNSFEYHETKGMVEKRTIDAVKALFDEQPWVKLTMIFWEKRKISTIKKTQLERYCHEIIWNAKTRIGGEPIDMT